MVIAVPIGPSWCGLCHSEGIGCSTSYGITSNWMRSPEIPKTYDNFDSRFRCKNPFLGDTQLHWWPIRRKNCISTVSVAADYPDSVPESSNYVAKLITKNPYFMSIDCQVIKYIPNDHQPILIGKGLNHGRLT